MRAFRQHVVLFRPKSDPRVGSSGTLDWLFRPGRFESASFVGFVNGFADVIALGFEELVDGCGESRFADEVRAACGFRVEASELLVGPSRPGFEPIETFVDAVFDGRVIADIEVKVPERSCGTPVSTVEGISLSNIECPRDPFVLVSRHDENKPGSE